MIRHVHRSIAVALAVAVTVAWLAPAAQAQGPHPIVRLAKKLAAPVDFPSIDDPRATLHDVLELLTERYALHFDINEKAFLMQGGGGAAAMGPRAGGNDSFVMLTTDLAFPVRKAAPQEKGSPPGKAAPQDKGAPPSKATPPGKAAPPGKPAPPMAPPANPVTDLMNSPVAATLPIPKMTGVRLETVLKRILARVPAQFGVTYVLRRDGIEITTLEAKLAEFRVPSDHASVGPEGGPPPDMAPQDVTLVQAEFDKRPLEQVLRELADTTDSTVILDVRAAEKAKAVTATLINVPLDTAVELLANMSGLQVVTRDRVLYVTTKDNADAMQKQMRERAGMGQNGMQGGPQPGGFGPLGPGQPGAPGIGPGAGFGGFGGFGGLGAPASPLQIPGQPSGPGASKN